MTRSISLMHEIERTSRKAIPLRTQRYGHPKIITCQHVTHKTVIIYHSICVGAKRMTESGEENIGPWGRQRHAKAAACCAHEFPGRRENCWFIASDAFASRKLLVHCQRRSCVNQRGWFIASDAVASKGCKLARLRCRHTGLEVTTPAVRLVTKLPVLSWASSS